MLCKSNERYLKIKQQMPTVRVCLKDNLAIWCSVMSRRVFLLWGDLRCLGAYDSNQDPLANRIARIESRDLKKPKHLRK